MSHIFQSSINKFIKICLAFLGGLIFTFSWAHTIKLVPDESFINPAHSVSILEDPSGKLNLEDVKSLDSKGRFKSTKIIGDQLNFGFTQSTYWLKLTLIGSKDSPEIWIVEIPYLGLDIIDFYINSRLVFMTGSERSIESRPLFYRYYAFPLVIKSGAPQDIYMRVASNSPLSVPIGIWQSESFSRHTQLDALMQASYYGGIGVLCIFNFLIFIYLRDKTYLLYSLFASFVGLGIFSGNGYGRLYLWSGHPGWDQIAQAFFLAIAAGNAWLFTRAFLNTRESSPKIDRLLLGCSLLLYTSAIGLLSSHCFAFSPAFFLKAVPLLSLPGAILTVYAAVRAFNSGQESAKFFLIAWGVLCLGTVIAALRMFDVIPSNGFTSYALQISSGLEMLLLSFALANRIQHERQLRELAQLDVLRSKQALVDSLRASEVRLEKTVAIRTYDLKVMLEGEKKLREQYVRFGSMISHEFRNPLGIIETQLALISRNGNEDKLKKRLSVIASATYRLGMLFDRWLQGDRLDSGVDSVRPQLIYLNEWLQDIVIKCQNYHSTHILQLTPCPKELSLKADEKMLQAVVLNLIDNACKYSEPGKVVCIQVKTKLDMIGISVSDEGIGIDSNDLHIIFEEYRQINPTSQSRGLGLGLAFVKRITSLHLGSVEVLSQPGYGSEFIAWFPEKTVEFLDSKL